MSIKTSYYSKEVDIPEEFLRVSPTPSDAKPITLHEIDFSKTALPECTGAYAVILDNVLSPTECTQLLTLAESSVREEDYGNDSSPWRRALVNVGAGREMLIDDYRRSDRIIWDSQEIVDRLWSRLATVPEMAARLGGLLNDDEPGARQQQQQRRRPGRPPKEAPVWRFFCINRRLRFLRYGAGEFFRPHFDGAYSEDRDGRALRTHFTIHLYLNDSAAEVPGAELQGGATLFLSIDGKRKVEVNPKMGRVLIFQHMGLYHSGDDVKEGIKYTVRTDIMYELLRRQGQEQGQEQ